MILWSTERSTTCTITTAYGLKKDSVVKLTLEFFHIVDGLVPDVRLNGSLQYEMKELQKHTIHTENNFTFDKSKVKNKKINDSCIVIVI